MGNREPRFKTSNVTLSSAFVHSSLNLSDCVRSGKTLSTLSGHSPETSQTIAETFWRLFRVPGLEAPADIFETFSAFRARRLRTLFPLTAVKNARNPKLVQNLSQRLFLGGSGQGGSNLEKFVKICPKITVFQILTNFSKFQSP